jgi:hypothetical protein
MPSEQSTEETYFRRNIPNKGSNLSYGSQFTSILLIIFYYAKMGLVSVYFMSIMWIVINNYAFVGSL